MDKIFILEKSDVSCVNSQWVYVIFSDLITAKRVCDQINANLRQNNQNSYHLIVVPSDLVAIQQLLEEEGVYGIVTLYTFPWELIRLNGSVLSYELPGLFKMLFVDGDRSMLSAVARSLWSLQMLFGRIPLILTQGRFSLQIRTMIDILFDELGSSDKADSEISCMLLVDRDVDYASVLLTPVTYVGLLDEVISINSDAIELDSRVVTGKQEGEEKKVTYHLTSTDAIYNEMKNRHFSDVYELLHSRVEKLKSEYDNYRKRALHDLMKYVRTKLPIATAEKRSLCYHISACEVIIGAMGHRFESLHKVEKNMLEGRNKRESFSYIEECFDRYGKLASLRLLCLLALTQNGLSGDEEMLLKTQFLHSFGYEHLVAFRNLEKLGLITQQGEGTNQSIVPSGGSEGATKLADRVAQVVSQLPKRGGSFQAFAHRLKLFPEVSEEYDLKDPKNPGYVFGGSYVPVVCQLVSLLIKKELSPDEVMKLGPRIGTTSWIQKAGEWSSPPQSFLVYFVGGVTYAEISAFHFLEQLTGARILVAGTSIINGNRFVQSLV